MGRISSRLLVEMMGKEMRDHFFLNFHAAQENQEIREFAGGMLESFWEVFPVEWFLCGTSCTARRASPRYTEYS